MTVEDNTSRNQYTATAGQTIFPYTFEVSQTSDLAVLQNGTRLVNGVDYTVSGAGDANGGNCTLTVGATAGDILTLYRDMPYDRTQDYQNNGPFLAQTVNADFDRLWLASEQTERGFVQAVRKPITDSDTIDMELPEAADRANKVLGFDSNGAVQAIDELANISVEYGDWTPVGSDAQSGGNNIQLTVQEASYAKLGQLVFVSCFITGINPAGGTGINRFFLQDLPFAPSSQQPTGFNVFGGSAQWDGVQGGPHSCQVVAQGTTGVLQFPVLSRAAVGSDFLTISDISNNADVTVSITYLTTAG